MTTVHVVAIEWDVIAVVSTRRTVDSRGLITSSARSRAWPCNDEGGWRIGNDKSRKMRGRHRGVWATNAGRKEGGEVANVPPSKIVALNANAEDREEGRVNSVCCPGGTKGSCMEGRGGRGIAIVVGRSKQCHRTTTYSAILIVRGMTVAAAVAWLSASPLCR